MRVYVPRDAAARSLGSDAVAQAVLEEGARRGLPVELVRNGSRGTVSSNPSWRSRPSPAAPPSGR
jgi:formate dehydrogenase iron-sulfur subunit